MEAWWNSGGALLWNQYGGFGTDRLILPDEELKAFVEYAGRIFGWQPDDQGYGFGAGPANPIIIRPYSPHEASPQPEEAHSPESKWCCSDCGRPLHDALSSERNLERVLVSKRDLNHVLNSLQEAIDFSRGKGPNNTHTWEAALQEFVASTKD